jgi:hypothetical protein
VSGAVVRDSGRIGRRASRVAALLAVTLAVSGLLVAGIAPSGPARAQGGPALEPGDGLLEALARVPADLGARSPVSYLDLRAVEAARPGALHPESVADLMAALEDDDEAARLWLAALMGVATGSAHLLAGLFPSGTLWPETVGFDFFDIDRLMTFGDPPSDGLVLLGGFDPAAVGRALEARGYDDDPRGTRTLWCGQEGCDTGQQPNLADRDLGNPFGGDLGRAEPLAVSARDLLNSADMATLEAMLAAAEDEGRSLAADPAVRAIAGAVPGDARLVQATLLSDLSGLDAGIAARFAESPDGATELLAELDEAFEPMPAWQRAAFADGATATEQVASVILAYASDEDAAVAADVLPRRYEALRSLVRDVPLADLFADRGVTSIAGRVVPASEGASAAAVIELRAPLAGDAPEPGSDRLPASSQVYRLLIDLLFTRDLLWLAPELPLG